MRDVTAMPDDLRARGTKFHLLTEAIGTTTLVGSAVRQMVGGGRSTRYRALIWGVRQSRS